MEFKKNFGVRIKELRIKKGLTQAELAELVGIDAKHMSHIETGRSFPKADLIEKFSSQLDTDTTTMFFFQHLKPKRELIKEINQLLHKASDNDVKRLYKLVTAYLF